jgi:hypothetical protein
MAVFSVDSYPEEEYEAYATRHPDLFRSVHLSIITVSSSEREARRVLSSITSGEITFEDAARAQSKDTYADRGGDMGIRMVHELSMDIPDIAAHEAVISLARGEYSDVYRTDSGWIFFRAEDAVQNPDTSDTFVMDKIRSYVRNYERGRMEDWATALADDFIALVNEHGFEEALAMKELEKKNFGPVPINYGNIDLFTTLSSQGVAEITASATNENFWRVAFSTPVGTPSRPVVQGSNVFVLLPVEETEAEESDQENIVSSYSYWLAYMTEQSLNQYFLSSPKMDDKFLEIYLRYFM